MRVVDDGAAVDLLSEQGAGFQDLASLVSFGGADGGALLEIGAAAEAFAAIQIKKRDIVAECGVTGNGTGATAFGITGVTSGNYNLETAGRLTGATREASRKGGGKDCTAG
jgi:hypothetical protein